MVLLHPHGIVVDGWKIFLKVLLDIVTGAYMLQQIDHPTCVALPVCGLDHRQIIGLTNLIEVNKEMCLPHNCKGSFHIKRGLQGNPCEDARVVKCTKRLETIRRSSSPALPLTRE